MANYNLKVPVTSLTAPTSWGSRSQIKSMLEKIWSNYGVFIKQSSENSKIPSSILASFIAVESGGNALAGGNGHVTQGLMQWNRNYAKAQLENELAKNRLTIGEREVLEKYGIKFDLRGKTRAITNADQKKPELNIAIGSIILGQLIDEKWGSDESGLHLDRVIAVYNAGAYGDTGKKARQLTTPKLNTPQLLSSNVNSITSAYIKKIMGVNGAMDIATSELNNIIK